ncbi:flagellar export protein FliJ [Alkalibacillus haloalkaliphilus]|uniref:flagellar export protein FliJ n=1 Tax=Alkalibacillus haloalkaliphilus TaxID=94136 RepID=UPI002936C542|nr:flagellar export protein FliJ [Alkalibacillus haloalkaliphilus]MDV2580601.1 flagellar export protein FliJ [Alkalibacillus haloalkaliphilus]
MSDLKTYEKMIQIKEEEMDQTQKQYNLAVEHFESEATKLYELLKSKENIESQYESQLSKGASIAYLNNFHHYIDSVQQQESNLQKKVHQARVNMYKKQEAVEEAYRELKKFEKLKDHKEEKQRLLNKQVEASFIDEIAVQQYSRAK